MKGLLTIGLAVILISASALSAGQESPASSEPELVSLLGRPLYAAPASGEALLKLEKDLAAAQAARRARPNDPQALILLGRSLAALWRFHEAIDVYSEGIRRWSANPLLFRHRGHRFISIREFEKAVIDLVKARTLKDNDFDILYHLGLLSRREFRTGGFGL